MSDAVSLDAGTPKGGALAGALLVLTAGVCFSMAGLFMRWMEEADPWQVLIYRSLSTLIFVLAALAWRGGGSPLPAIRALGWTGLLAGAGLSVAMMLFIVALTLTTVFNTVMMICIAPLLAALLGRLVLGESVRRMTVVAMLVACAGVGIMVHSGLEGGDLLGNLLSLLAACGFAVFAVTLRAAKLRDTMPAVAWAALIGVVVSLLVVLGEGKSPFVSLHDIGLAAGMGILQIGIGMLFFTAGAKRLTAAEATLLSLSEVVLAPIWVWVLLDETPSETTLVGGAVLLGAMVLQAATGVRRRPPVGLV